MHCYSIHIKVTIHYSICASKNIFNIWFGCTVHTKKEIYVMKMKIKIKIWIKRMLYQSRDNHTIVKKSNGNWFIFRGFICECYNFLGWFNEKPIGNLPFYGELHVSVRRELIVSLSIYYAAWIEIWQWNRSEMLPVFLAQTLYGSL